MHTVAQYQEFKSKKTGYYSISRTFPTPKITDTVLKVVFHSFEDNRKITDMGSVSNIQGSIYLSKKKTSYSQHQKQRLGGCLLL
jgi:virulence-associated protein VapD